MAEKPASAATRAASALATPGSNRAAPGVSVARNSRRRGCDMAAVRSTDPADDVANGGQGQLHHGVIPGPRAARDPESRDRHGACLWIPGSRASLAPRNDGGWVGPPTG